MLAFIFLAGLISCNGNAGEQKNDTRNINESSEYTAYFEQMRKSKDGFFLTSDSPLTDSGKKSFKGLVYYPVRSAYRFRAKYTPYDPADTVEILTTKNKVRKILRHSKLSFEVNKKEFSLTAYMSPDHTESLFVPFTDQTCGEGSYEGGRYIDLLFDQNAPFYYLDFNECYSPYCAYNEKYSCPIVPAENHLKFRVEAGEKDYKNK